MGKTVRIILACVSVIVLSGLFWVFPDLSPAQEEPDPVVLEADSVVYDQERGTATAIGNAKVRYGLLRLFADSIFLDEDMTRLKATSPAFKLGFEKIDLSTVGVRPSHER